MAPHSKTCCAIPAHLHVIELLCFASIFKASRFMKMKWTKSGRVFCSCSYLSTKNVDGMHGASFL